MSKRNLWFRDNHVTIEVELHDIDANHALEVDPEHWSVEKPADPVAPEEKKAED